MRTVFDWIQGIIDLFKNMDDGFKFKDLKIMYSYSDLNDKANKEKNNFTKVSSESKNEEDDKKSGKNDTVNKTNESNKTTWQKEVPVDNKHEGFTKKSTNIPVITVDFYTIATGKIKFFDINFLNTGDNDHGDTWNAFRDLAANIMHMAQYIAVAVLLTILIIYGIRIIYNSTSLKKEIDKNFTTQKTPQEMVNYKEGIKQYAISLVIVVGVIAYMALCIYLSDFALELLKIGNPNDRDSEEFPIRVTVDGVYSFSTNPIGYFRFMSVSKDLADQRMYTLAYMGLVAWNGICAGFMVARVVQIYVLSILGPLIVVAYAARLEKHMPMDLQTWARRYFMISFIQVLIAVFYKVIEYTAIS